MVPLLPEMMITGSPQLDMIPIDLKSITKSRLGLLVPFVTRGEINSSARCE